MWSLVVVNTWRGMPFYGITLLAGLQTISPDLYEAAAIDGATTTQRFLYVTLPIIKPVLIIVTMFSVIFTFGDFQLIYALTHGGPANATHVFSTWAFDIGMSAGQLGMGAAVALTMLPALAVLIVGSPSTCGASSPDHGWRTRLRDPAAAAVPAAGHLPRADAVPLLLDAITSIKPNRELYSQKIMPLVVTSPR